MSRCSHCSQLATLAGEYATPDAGIQALATELSAGEAGSKIGELKADRLWLPVNSNWKTPDPIRAGCEECGIRCQPYR